MQLPSKNSPLNKQIRPIKKSSVVVDGKILMRVASKVKSGDADKDLEIARDINELAIMLIELKRVL